MSEKSWVDTLHEKGSKEFSFFPLAYTPMEQEAELPLPEIEIELGKEEEEEEDKSAEGASSTSYTLSLTIGGITLGAVMGAGAMYAATPTPLCPLVPASQQIVQATSTPASSGGQSQTPTPPRQTPAATQSNATTSSAQTGTPTPNTSSTTPAEGGAGTSTSDGVAR